MMTPRPGRQRGVRLDRPYRRQPPQPAPRPSQARAWRFIHAQLAGLPYDDCAWDEDRQALLDLLHRAYQHKGNAWFAYEALDFAWRYIDDRPRWAMDLIEFGVLNLFRNKERLKRDPTLAHAAAFRVRRTGRRTQHAQYLAQRQRLVALARLHVRLGGGTQVRPRRLLEDISVELDLDFDRLLQWVKRFEPELEEALRTPSRALPAKNHPSL